MRIYSQLGQKYGFSDHQKSNLYGIIQTLPVLSVALVTILFWEAWPMKPWKGGDGVDTLNGSTGNDSLLGGNGNDVYTGFTTTTGSDTINDTAGTDTANFSTVSTTAATWTAVDSNTDGYLDQLKIDFGSQNVVYIENYFNNTANTVGSSTAGSGVVESLVFSNNGNVTFSTAKGLVTGTSFGSIRQK